MAILLDIGGEQVASAPQPSPFQSLGGAYIPVVLMPLVFHTCALLFSPTRSGQ